MTEKGVRLMQADMMGRSIETPNTVMQKEGSAFDPVPFYADALTPFRITKSSAMPYNNA